MEYSVQRNDIPTQGLRGLPAHPVEDPSGRDFSACGKKKQVRFSFCLKPIQVINYKLKRHSDLPQDPQASR